MSKPDRYWKVIRHDGEVYIDIGVDKKDGSVYNPHGYPEDIVRAAVAGAEARQHERRSAAAKKAAQTRQKRREKLVYRVVQRLRAGGVLTPGTHCEICGKGLTDPESEARGIGSDCWQSILTSLQAAKAVAK
jgi:uncharacterized Zn finger protein (UPF0148 family)